MTFAIPSLVRNALAFLDERDATDRLARRMRRQFGRRFLPSMAEARVGKQAERALHEQANLIPGSDRDILKRFRLERYIQWKRCFKQDHYTPYGLKVRSLTSLALAVETLESPDDACWAAVAMHEKVGQYKLVEVIEPGYVDQIHDGHTVTERVVSPHTYTTSERVRFEDPTVDVLIGAMGERLRQAALLST